MIPFAPKQREVQPRRKRLSKNKHKHQNSNLQDIVEESELPTASAPGGEVENVQEKPSKQTVTFRAVRAYLEMRLDEVRKLKWEESDVRPYKEKQVRRIMPYRVKRVVSPFEFYLEYAFDDECNNNNYEQFFNQMQLYYEDAKNVKEMALIRGKVLKGRCYACKDPTDGKWHRVRAHGVNRATQSAVVFFCDIGKMQEMPFQALLEINQLFVRNSAQLFRAYLFDIMSVGGGGSQGLAWTGEACNYFKDLVNGKVFDGIVMARSDAEVSEGLPDAISMVGVVLFPRKPGAIRSQLPCTVNAQMVDKGFSKANGIFAGCKHAVSSARVLEAAYDVKEMESLYPSGPRTSQENPGDDRLVPSMLSQKELSVLIDSPIRFVTPPEKNWLPDFISDLKPDFLAVPKDSLVADICLPDKLAEQITHVKLSFVMGPDLIILHLYSQLEDMHNMQKAIERACSAVEPLKKEEIRPGMFVACQMVGSNTNQKRNTGIWTRGIVKQVARDSTFKLLLVDYGNDVSIPQGSIYTLPDFFSNIPSFAHRVHLDVTGVKPCGTTWSSDCGFGFRRYIFAWEGRDPVYYMYRPHQSSWIELEDFNQGVAYNFEEQKWIAGPKKMIALNQPVNEKREHVMLRSLFNSVGVEINYEIMVRDSAFWHFHTVVDHVIQSGYGVFHSKPPEAITIHMNLVELLVPAQHPEAGSSKAKTRPGKKSKVANIPNCFTNKVVGNVAPSRSLPEGELNTTQDAQIMSRFMVHRKNLDRASVEAAAGSETDGNDDW